ncbi:MAG TPA: carbon-nitrogen hydrolase family protein [Myxococcota bacterium]|nr:carbon-nitrogen hydrolase family protein [Myxococcota bacterium]
MRITVCEFPDEESDQETAWKDLVGHVHRNRTDVVVLPEMPFCAWQMFTADTVDLAAWQRALSAHDTMAGRFGELSPAIVLGSRPVSSDGKRLNQAFGWTREGGYRGARSKYYLPDEPDGRESTWFARGDPGFAPLSVGSWTFGFQICTELLFTDASWRIGRAGAQVIAAPRATGGHPRWPLAARMAAILSGCFVASANRRSRDGEAFAGRSWVVSPEGEILGETTADEPFLTVEVDLGDADRAKRSYPRNLP